MYKKIKTLSKILQTGLKQKQLWNTSGISDLLILKKQTLDPNFQKYWFKALKSPQLYPQARDLFLSPLENRAFFQDILDTLHQYQQIELLKNTIHEILKIWYAEDGRLEVILETAYPLSSSEYKAIQRSLEEKWSKKIVLLDLEQPHLKAGWRLHTTNQTWEINLKDRLNSIKNQIKKISFLREINI